MAKSVSQPTPNVATSGGQPQPAAPTPFRTQQAVQFDAGTGEIIRYRLGAGSFRKRRAIRCARFCGSW